MGENNRRYRKVAFYIPEKGRRRKRKKIFDKGIPIYIFSAEENKNKEKEKEENIWRMKIFFAEKRIGEGKRGNYLEKENVCLSRKRKREKEKDKNIWISKYFLVGGGGGGGEGGEGGEGGRRGEEEEEYS